MENKKSEEKKPVNAKGQKKGSGEDKTIPHHHLTKQVSLNNLYYSFHKEELEQTLQALNKHLEKAGVKLTADEYTYLTIDIDQEKFNSVTKRKAGRRKKKTSVLYEQVMEYAKTHTSMETAEWLGLTRQTYYRKLKEHRENNHDGKIDF